MGVFRLFYHFINTYPDIVKTIYKNENCKKLGLDIDVLAIDLNAVFHPCCQLVYRYGQKKNSTSLLHRNKERSKEPLHVLQKKAFAAITRAIDDLVNYNKPKQTLYLAIDGVAGMSKQTQQRQRRFRYAKDISEDTFDSNSITTGTLFMDELSRYIGNFIQIKLKSDWSHLKVIYNNGRVVGEGEHKLIHYIKTMDKQLTASIVSPDADLIMLALGLNRNGVYIFRENIFDNFDGDYFFVYIDRLRERIVANVNPKIYEPKESKQPEVNSSVEYYIKRKNKYGNLDNMRHRMLEDFIFYLFMLGNDFLPHIPSLEIPNDGIATLLKCYDKVISEYGFISQHYTTASNTNNIKISYIAFKELLKSLSELETTMLLQKVYRRMTHNDKTLEDNIHKTDNGYTIDFKKYRRDYYIKKLKFGIKLSFEEEKEVQVDDNLLEEQIKKLVYEYTRGMVFVLKYYLYNIPTFDWFYPYHYAPLLTDIYNYLPEDIDNLEFDFVEPLSPLEQLLCVLPPQSYRLVPKELHPLMLSKDTPLIHMYPKSFKIDLEGKKNDYEGICLLPFTDSDLIRREFKNVCDKLSDTDKRRNQPGFVYEYNLNKNKEVEYKYFK